MKWAGINLQDANSSIMEMMIFFHDHAMMLVVMIMSLIFYMIVNMVNNKFINRYLLQGQMIEFIWTAFPVFFLVFLAIPSLTVLYISDETNFPLMTIKVFGHQWYWSYEYDDINNLNFDSFMLNDFEAWNFRLLDVDNRMVVPSNLMIRFLISSDDVIHSFTIPSAGMKVDAVPGRLNQICMKFLRVGVFFGQCSEICGVNHSFMPIVLEVTPLESFSNWLSSKIDG